MNTYSFWHNPKATWNNNSDSALYWTPHTDETKYAQQLNRETPVPQFTNYPEYFKQHEPRLEHLLNYTELIPTQLPPTHRVLIHRENLVRRKQKLQ